MTAAQSISSRNSYIYIKTQGRKLSTRVLGWMIKEWVLKRTRRKDRSHSDRLKLCEHIPLYIKSGFSFWESSVRLWGTTSIGMDKRLCTFQLLLICPQGQLYSAYSIAAHCNCVRLTGNTIDIIIQKM